MNIYKMLYNGWPFYLNYANIKQGFSKINRCIHNNGQESNGEESTATNCSLVEPIQLPYDM